MNSVKPIQQIGLEKRDGVSQSKTLFIKTGGNAPVRFSSARVLSRDIRDTQAPIHLSDQYLFLIFSINNGWLMSGKQWRDDRVSKFQQSDFKKVI